MSDRHYDPFGTPMCPLPPVKKQKKKQKRKEITNMNETKNFKFNIGETVTANIVNAYIHARIAMNIGY